MKTIVNFLKRLFCGIEVEQLYHTVNCISSVVKVAYIEKKYLFSSKHILRVSYKAPELIDHEITKGFYVDDIEDYKKILDKVCDKKYILGKIATVISMNSLYGFIDKMGLEELKNEINKNIVKTYALKQRKSLLSAWKYRKDEEKMEELKNLKLFKIYKHTNDIKADILIPSSNEENKCSKRKSSLKKIIDVPDMVTFESKELNLQLSEKFDNIPLFDKFEKDKSKDKHAWYNYTKPTIIGEDPNKINEMRNKLVEDGIIVSEDGSIEEKFDIENFFKKDDEYRGSVIEYIELILGLDPFTK
jgi:hypothetical protein